jgi:hypothetical protein
MLFSVVVNTKEKLCQVFYESANYYAKLCDIFVLKYIRLRKFYKILMASSTLVACCRVYFLIWRCLMSVRHLHMGLLHASPCVRPYCMPWTSGGPASCQSLLRWVNCFAANFGSLGVFSLRFLFNFKNMFFQCKMWFGGKILPHSWTQKFLKKEKRNRLQVTLHQIIYCKQYNSTLNK